MATHTPLPYDMVEGVLFSPDLVPHILGTLEAEDAAAAVDNMDNAELFGRVLRVNVAANKRLRSEALWSATEDQTWEERRRDEAQVAAAKAARQP